MVDAGRPLVGIRSIGPISEDGMSAMQCAPRTHRAKLVGSVGLLLAFSLLLGARPAAAVTLRTITVDGVLNDWTEVLLDAPQTVADKSTAQGDPDAPGQSQRDER